MGRKLRSPGILAAYAAALITLLGSLILAGILYYQGVIRLWHLLFCAIALYTGSYLVFILIIRSFIIQRINHIYRTFYFLRPNSRSDLRENANGQRDMLARTQTQVEEWARDRREEYERLKQMADYRRQFLGNVSHELKTPIFNIQGYVLTLLDGGLDDPNINMEYLRRTEKSVDRLIAIVNDLEAIGKLEAGELELNQERFDIVELAREVMEFLEIKAQNKKTMLFFEGRYDKPIFVNADRERIKQVLINLIDNAIKYRRKKLESITGIAFFVADDHVLVEITDNGIGVSDQDIPRLFERFYRTEGARMRSKSGSGLGLAIVKHIIEAHEQTISVRSKENEGTTFGFTLKRADTTRRL
jgi:two-component system, OmpR family, phosphate regulon sensor histidine kinase PhoR